MLFHRSQQQGFTLIELLVVIAIVALLSSLIIFLPSSDRRNAAVRSAAEELAATLRSARTLAMRQSAVVGVAFNIRNGLGTSGLVLNNHDGGHWYRIIGPDEIDLHGGGDATWSFASYPRALDFVGDDGGGNPKYDRFVETPAGFLEVVAQSWIGDRHVLAPKKVRFLALSDQDNGTVVDPPSNEVYPTTYPRPWFGYWEGGRLYPWGGYDHSIVDVRGQHSSAFCFEGDDGAITGSANPSDRFTTYANYPIRKIFAAGEARPVVNGDWLDYVIRFYPDGTVDEGPIMEARLTSYRKRTGQYWPAGGDGRGDLGDMCAWSNGASYNNWYQMPMTSYVEHTGNYAITLAADMDRDTDQFASAQQAFKSITPAYRVTVNRYGFVQVVKVVHAEPAGVAWDTTITPADWQTAAKLKYDYRYNYAVKRDRTPRGMPVTNFLTPDVLASRNWWMTAP